jgi:hypothetical protein
VDPEIFLSDPDPDLDPRTVFLNNGSGFRRPKLIMGPAGSGSYLDISVAIEKNRYSIH